MSRLSVANKIFLEDVLEMSEGYVLDFTNASFALLFSDLHIDIYDEKYAELGTSKANRLRALWKNGSDLEVSSALDALADYIEAKKAAGGWSRETTSEQIAKIRTIARELASPSSSESVSGPVPVTTEATVTNNKISIEIHEDIYNHIRPYLTTGDYFHAVEESYKLVRKKLRDITGSEKATQAFAAANYEKLFGHKPADDTEKDFFEGVKFLNMAIQFLRNEKAHTPATALESNLAVHYVSLASLAYDLITQHVSEETIQEIEELVITKRRSYRSATAFYKDFENGKWLQGFDLPPSMASTSVRKALKEKWLEEADFTQSYDHSNIVLMRLELVVDQLKEADLDRLLDLPTHDSYGNWQAAGLLPLNSFNNSTQRSSRRRRGPGLLKTSATDAPIVQRSRSVDRSEQPA